MIMFRMYVWLADDEEIRVRDSFQFGQRRQHRESCEWSQNSTSTAPGRKPTKLHITYLRKWACEATRDHHRRGLLDRMKPPSIFEGKQDRTGHVNVRQRKEKSNSAMVDAVGTFSWIICHKSSNSCEIQCSSINQDFIESLRGRDIKVILQGWTGDSNQSYRVIECLAPYT